MKQLYATVVSTDSISMALDIRPTMVSLINGFVAILVNRKVQFAKTKTIKRTESYCRPDTAIRFVLNMIEIRYGRLNLNKATNTKF